MSTCRVTIAAACLAFGSATSALVLAQGAAPGDWTAQERQFVADMRALYQKQGISFSDGQAQAAVIQMRERQKPVRKGIPPSEWTPQEAAMVGKYRESFAKQGLPFGDDQAAMAVQSMREQLARFTGSMAALQNMAGQRAIPPMPAMPIAAAPATYQPSPGGAGFLSEEQLAAQLERLPPKAGNLSLKERREGFVVNGEPIVDAEGRITMYNFDVLTGDITYAVDTPGNTTVKFMRAGSNIPPVAIATAIKSPAGWSVQTVTGQRLAGPALSMMARGLLVARPGAAFRYDPGRGVRNIAVPEGYVLTPIQRGSVGTTGFLLLEKDNADNAGNDLGKVFNSFKALGSTLGLTKKEDYALFNSDTGTLYPLNMHVEGRNVTALSDCYRRKQNSVINECYRAQMFESLYEQSGDRNIRHYYWRAYWMQTPRGPIAVTMENGSRDVFIIDLATGKKVSAFHRSLGINVLDVVQRPDGIVQVDAQLAFERQSIPDAGAFLVTAAPAGNEETASAAGKP